MRSRSYIVRNAEKYVRVSNFLACTTALAPDPDAHQGYVRADDNQSFCLTTDAPLGLGAVAISGREYSAYSLSDSFQAAPERRTLFIADLGDPRLLLRAIVPVLVESSGTQTYAYSYDLDELAIGSDEGQAISEMKALIAETYFLLKDERDALGPLQQQHWAFLQRLIGEVG